MYEYKDMKIIAVDHGYGNIKTANNIIPTGILHYDAEPIFTGNILQYQGKWHRIGEEHKDFIPDKSTDEDFYLLTMAAIAGELARKQITDANVLLACGLPLKWVQTQRDAFRKYLMQNPELRFKYNGCSYHIHLQGCRIYPQGYPAIVQNLGAYQGTHMLADIGNGTMNILYIQDKKPLEARSWTEKCGVNQCMIRAQSAVLDHFGVRVSENTVEQILRTGKADVEPKYLECIRKVAIEYAEDIFRILRKYEYSQDLMRLHITGGGASLIRNFGTYDKNRVEIIEDIRAAARGYEYLAYQELLRKDIAS